MDSPSFKTVGDSSQGEIGCWLAPVDLNDRLDDTSCRSTLSSDLTHSAICRPSSGPFRPVRGDGSCTKLPPSTSAYGPFSDFRASSQRTSRLLNRSQHETPPGRSPPSSCRLQGQLKRAHRCR